MTCPEAPPPPEAFCCCTGDDGGGDEEELDDVGCVSVDGDPDGGVVGAAVDGGERLAGRWSVGSGLVAALFVVDRLLARI